jgi:hypothetical protein
MYEYVSDSVLNNESIGNELLVDRYNRNINRVDTELDEYLRSNNSGNGVEY